MSRTTERKTMLGRSLDPSPRVEKILAARPLAAEAEQRFEHQTAAVLFSDIVGSTAYFEEHGDEAGMAMVERHNELLFPLVSTHDGTIIKTIGDAIMASFPTAEAAVKSAVAMQQKLKEHNATQEEGQRISVRIGINYGKVILREQDLFGDVVNAAARVEALARGRMILVSAAVLEQLPADLGIPYASFDAVFVKGKKEPVEVFQIRWHPDEPLTPPDAAPLPKVGDVLGNRFEILALLGAGGMGQVFRARDRALDEEVALKFIHGSLSRDADTISRFKQEVKLARSVTHRNICRIHEFLQVDGHTFLSMERVDGVTVSETLAREGRFQPEAAVEIVAGICRGLQEAHGRNVTHRDLKPSNVMIETDSGRVVIMDFGIALLTTTSRNTGEGLVVGTPEYMSPEQAQGIEVGPASDIYAVGAIFYELLLGKPPHTADTPLAVAIKNINEEPEPPRAVRPEIPQEIEDVVLRCLRKNPADRYPDARSLLQALVGDRTTAMLPPARRSRPVLVAEVLILGVGLAFLLYTLVRWATGPGAGPHGPRNLRLLVSSKQVEHSPRWSPDGQAFAFIKKGDVYLQPLQAGRPTRVSTSVGALDDVDLSDISWSGRQALLVPSRQDQTLLLKRLDSGDRGVTTVLPNAAAADLSPDGEWLAFTDVAADGSLGIGLARPDGADRKILLAGDATTSYLRPRWSPDGKRLALVVHHTGYQSSRDIGVVDIGSGKLRLLTRDGSSARANNVDPDWGPDGNWVVYASKRSGAMSLWAVPARGGKSIPVTQGATNDQRGPDVSPDGSSILFATDTRQLDILTLDLQPEDKPPTSQTADLWVDRFPVWSPDGTRIAFRTHLGGEPERRFISILQYDSGETESFLGPAGLRDFVWCGDERLVFAATVGEDRQLGFVNLGDKSVGTIVKGFLRLWTPTGDPQCQNIVFCGQKTEGEPRRLWRTTVGGGLPVEATSTPGWETYPAFSPDGKKIAYRWYPSENGIAKAQLRVIASTGSGKASPATVTSADSFRRSQRRLRWSSDGRHLFYVESVPSGGMLWRVPSGGGRPVSVARMKNIDTFDFDLSPERMSLVYPGASRFGDVFVLDNVEW